MRRGIRLLALLALAALGGVQAEERRNAFDDPFLQVSAGLAGCPVPRGPAYTEAQVRELGHVRAEHGTSCFRSGRCRLPNSYLYDKEIIPRVQQYLRQDGRFGGTSVWVLGERRIVTLMGCVGSEQQKLDMERAVLLVDDVAGVVNQLMVGTRGRPGYVPRRGDRTKADKRTGSSPLLRVVAGGQGGGRKDTPMHRPLATAAFVLFAAAPAFAADKGLPADQVIAAIQAAVAAQPGQVKEVDVDEKRNGVTVKVEIVATDGKEHEVRIDPATRQVVRK